MLNKSVGVFMNEQCKHQCYQKVVNYMQCRNFCDQLRKFYFRYLNINLADGVNINGSGKYLSNQQVNQIKSIKLKLEHDEENLISVAKQCFTDWHEQVTSRIVDHAKRELSTIHLSEDGSKYQNAVSARLKSEYLHKANDEFSEEFIINLLVSQLLIKRYDFLKTLTEVIQINLEMEPEKLNDLPVSANFLGNFWRFAALFKLREAQ